MSDNSTKVSKVKNERGLTVKQESFLEAYDELFDIYRAADKCGIARSNIMADLRKDTAFAREFKGMTKRIEDDPRFTKTGAIGNLLKIKRDIEDDTELRSSDRYKLLLEIQKEINKMVDGNLASQKKVIEKKTIDVKAVYDFTSLPVQEQPRTIDIKAEEV